MSTEKGDEEKCVVAEIRIFGLAAVLTSFNIACDFDIENFRHTFINLSQPTSCRQRYHFHLSRPKRAAC